MATMEAFVDIFPGMFPSIVTAVVVFATLSVVASFLKPSSVDVNRLPPKSPESLLHIYIRNGFRFIGPEAPMRMLKIAREMGTSVFRLPIGVLVGTHFVAVCDYKVARKIFEHPGSLKPVALYQVFNKIIGGVSFFSSEGPRFKHVRKPIMGAFHATMLQRMETIIQQLLHTWRDTNLKAFVENDMAFDFAREMKHLTIAIISEIGFEYKVNEDERSRIIECLTTNFEEFGSRCVLRPDREVLWFLSSEGRKARRGVKWLQAFGRTVLESYREKKKCGEAHDGNTAISYIESDTEYANDNERICDMLFFFGAGFDTTSNALSFLFRELAQHESEQDKLRWDLGKGTTIDKCATLHNCIRETLRLYPTIPMGVSRHVPEDILLSDGEAVIPKGSIAMLCPYPIMRNEAVFEQPDEFIPSRWNHASRAMNESFLPFGLGRRNCLGKALASVELKIIVSELVRNYEIGMEREGRVQYNITLNDVGTRLKFIPVSSRSY